MQMSDCCERLLEEDYPDLKNTTLIVSKYYHVNEDGQISIPWNWKWISYLDGRHICFHFALFLSGVSKMEIATYNYYKYVIFETGNN